MNPIALAFTFAGFICVMSIYLDWRMIWKNTPNWDLTPIIGEEKTKLLIYVMGSAIFLIGLFFLFRDMYVDVFLSLLLFITAVVSLIYMYIH